MTFALGIVMALAFMLVDRWVFAPFPSVAELIHNAKTGGTKPSARQGFLASFYGTLDEEILMRLGLLSLLALAFRTLFRKRGGNRELVLPTGVFWAANIVAAVIFGLGHLPATAALAPLSVALVIKAVVELYRRYGLEWAMTSHFGVDIVAHVALA
jgi:membrane protease YdiL (CAAX protease family)